MPSRLRAVSPGRSCLLALRQMSALAVVLCVGVGEEAGAQEHGVLAIFLAQRIHTLIQVRQPLQPDHLAKQIKLHPDPVFLQSGTSTIPPVAR